jgi:hypothetical protein
VEFWVVHLEQLQKSKTVNIRLHRQNGRVLSVRVLLRPLFSIDVGLLPVWYVVLENYQLTSRKLFLNRILQDVSSFENLLPDGGGLEFDLLE